MKRPETPTPALSPERVEALAEALGAMPEAYNVFDHTDEAATLIKADVDHLAEALAPLIGAWLAEEWEEAGELAGSVIVSWQAVPGLHPTEPEPHPAAIAAAGARRTLTVLRSRMSEAFTDAARIARSTP